MIRLRIEAQLLAAKLVSDACIIVQKVDYIRFVIMVQLIMSSCCCYALATNANTLAMVFTSYLKQSMTVHCELTLAFHLTLFSPNKLNVELYLVAILKLLNLLWNCNEKWS